MPPNNFDFLRLALACFVVLGHQFKLTAHPMFGVDLHNRVAITVLAFFSISGYLIAQSWERDPSAWRFFAKRVLRIGPGLMVVTIATVFVLGPLVSTLPWQDYFYSPQTWHFLRRLGTKIQHLLPGVFVDNPEEATVNGSLWTIPSEFYCYLMVLAFGLVGLLRHRPVILMGTVALAVCTFAIFDFQHNPNQKHHLDLWAFFCYGVCLHYFRDFWTKRSKRILLVLGLISAALVVMGYQYAALFLVLPLVAIIFGSASTPYIRHAGRFGDFSYGIYIYGFPVQQTVIMLAGDRLSMWTTLLIVSVITLVLAMISWHCIERPALQLKRYLGQCKQPTATLHTTALGPPERFTPVG